MNNILFLLESNLTPNLKDAFSKGIENASEPIYKCTMSGNYVINFYCYCIFYNLCNILHYQKNH